MSHCRTWAVRTQTAWENCFRDSLTTMPSHSGQGPLWFAAQEFSSIQMFTITPRSGSQLNRFTSGSVSRNSFSFCVPSFYWGQNPLCQTFLACNNCQCLCHLGSYIPSSRVVCCISMCPDSSMAATCAQIVIHVIAHRGCVHTKRVCTESWLGEKNMPHLLQLRLERCSTSISIHRRLHWSQAPLWFCVQEFSSIQKFRSSPLVHGTGTLAFKSFRPCQTILWLWDFSSNQHQGEQMNILLVMCCFTLICKECGVKKKRGIINFEWAFDGSF